MKQVTDEHIPMNTNYTQHFATYAALL